MIVEDLSITKGLRVLILLLNDHEIYSNFGRLNLEIFDSKGMILSVNTSVVASLIRLGGLFGIVRSIYNKPQLGMTKFVHQLRFIF